ncbi:hypothetical protein D3C81_1798470 [compost metagenome]
MQCLAIVAPIACATPVVEVSDGEASLGPVLDAWVEYRVARRGRPAMDKHHQGGGRANVHGRVEETMGDAVAAGVADSVRLADGFGG